MSGDTIDEYRGGDSGGLQSLAGLGHSSTYDPPSLTMPSPYLFESL